MICVTEDNQPIPVGCTPPPPPRFWTQSLSHRRCSCTTSSLSPCSGRHARPCSSTRANGQPREVGEAPPVNVNVNVYVNELRLGFSNITRNPELQQHKELTSLPLIHVSFGGGLGEGAPVPLSAGHRTSRKRVPAFPLLPVVGACRSTRVPAPRGPGRGVRGPAGGVRPHQRAEGPARARGGGRGNVCGALCNPVPSQGVCVSVDGSGSTSGGGGWAIDRRCVHACVRTCVIAWVRTCLGAGDPLHQQLSAACLACTPVYPPSLCCHTAR
jgi:hypothetical protein